MVKLSLTASEVEAVQQLAASGLDGYDYLRGMRPLTGDARRAALRMCKNTWELSPLGGNSYELRRKEQAPVAQVPVHSAGEMKSDTQAAIDAWDRIYDATEKKINSWETSGRKTNEFQTK